MAATDETKAKLDAAKAELEKAEKEHTDAQEAAKRPRPVLNILVDFAKAVAGRMGQHPELTRLVKEFEMLEADETADLEATADATPATPAS